MVRRNVELETLLIDDLLNLTRITKGKIDLVMREVDLHEILKESLEICKADHNEQGQTVDFSLLASNSMVEGDPVRLEQIFWNLIRNASKFSERHATIYIDSLNTESDKIEVGVRDEGVGIDPTILPSLFSPFEQGGEEVTRRFGGLGLGLSISRSIAELHKGGKIHAASAGKGRSARFILSMDVIPQDASLSQSSPPCKGQVRTADSIKSGMDMAQRYKFDCVISDLELGDGTGHELMRKLQKKFNLPGIAISGYGMAEDVKRSKDAGFSFHLTKPITLANIEEAILQIIPA